MDIKWNWGQDVEYLGEKLPPDTLDRKKYAKYLYEVCSARGENSNLVININAQWGAGKTYFTKRLAKTISDDHPTIYIDAWKEDFSEDPILTVFSSIKEQLINQSDKFTQLIDETVENIGPLLKTATPVIIDGLVKKFIGIESISDLSKNLSEKLLEIHAEKSKKIEIIKKGISRWVEFIKRKDNINKNLPIFIIIDELDRCRPDFSISLLEITKHIFNIPGVVFIIATDTEQLQHSIKVIYGSNFSASHYLSRFFDRRFLLPSPKIGELLFSKTGDNIISEFSKLRTRLLPSPPDFQTFIDNCASILEALKINLRDSLKIFERLIDMTITAQREFDPTLMLILLSLNFKDHSIYSDIKNNDTSSIRTLTNEIYLTFDLSYETTGVNFLRSRNDYIKNNYQKKEIITTVKNYIEESFNVLAIQNRRPVNSQQSDIPDDWINSYLKDNESLSTYLRMGFARSKIEKNELKTDQYYDLIELSTTFD